MPCCAKSLQSCPTLCDPMDCRPPGSSVLGILQEHWSGLPFPLPVSLPDQGIKPESLKSPALAGWFFTTMYNHIFCHIYNHILTAIFTCYIHCLFKHVVVEKKNLRKKEI